MNEVVCFDEPASYDVEKEIDVAGGQYWRYIGESCMDVIHGRLLLVASLNIIDGYLHSLQIFYHPSSKKSGDFRIDAQEFFEKFEYVQDSEAQRVRDTEMSKVRELIDQTRNEMLIGYVDETGMKASEAMHAIAHAGTSDIDNFHSATSSNIAVIEQQSERISALAEKQKKFVSSKAVILKENTSLLASYYTEQGQQALASVSQVFKFVKKLDSGIRTLGIFLGRGVSITRLSSGDEASSDVPLTFYQRKLYLDEEWFFNMLDGGCDFMDFATFSSALEADFSVIDRMLPSERSVVLVQYRRYDKKYFDYDEMKSFADKFAATMKEAALNQENKECFLLIRNGQNVFKVESEDLRGGERLFPTAVEIDDCYRSNKYGMRFGGVTDDAKFKPSDLEYVEARDKHDTKAVYYKRVLLMLFGVYSREQETFGTFMGSEKYESWYMGDFQQTCCAFVHDDEDALDHQRPTASEWIRTKNRMEQSGSRIVADWDKMMSVDSAPGAYSNKDAYMNWRPKERFALTVVKASGSDLYVEAPCKHQWNDTERNIKVYLEYAEGYLVLDDVNYNDITMYFNSRKERQYYENFISVLLKAREILEEEAKIVAPFRAELLDAVKKHFKNNQEDEVVSAVDDGIRLWRAINGGKLVPSRDSGEYLKALEAIGKNVWGSMNGDHLAPIYDYIKDNGIDAVRLTMDGRGNYFLYEDADERFLLGREMPIFLKRTKLRVGKRSCSADNAMIVSALKVPSERVVEEYKNRTFDERIHFSVGTALDEISNLIVKTSEALNRYAIEGMDEETAHALVTDFKNAKPTGNYVSTPHYCFPLCLAGHYAHGGKYDYRYTKAMMTVAMTSGTGMVAAFGSDEAYLQLQDIIRKKFHRPAPTLDRLALIRESRNPFGTFGYYEFELSGMVATPRTAIVPGSFKQSDLYSIAKRKSSHGVNSFDASFSWEQSIRGFCMGQTMLSLDGYTLENKEAFMISVDVDTSALWEIVNPLKTDSRILCEMVFETKEYALVVGKETRKSMTDMLGVDPGQHAWGFNPKSIYQVVSKDDGKLYYVGSLNHSPFEIALGKDDVSIFTKKVEVPIDEHSARIVEESMDIDFFEFVKMQNEPIAWRKREYNGTRTEYISIEENTDD